MPVNEDNKYISVTQLNTQHNQTTLHSCKNTNDPSTVPTGMMVEDRLGSLQGAVITYTGPEELLSLIFGLARNFFFPYSCSCFSIYIDPFCVSAFAKTPLNTLKIESNASNLAEVV